MEPTIPYPEIRTLFLDVGNTLVSMDFEWVRSELQALGVDCRVEDLRRAEAAARPAVSREVARGRGTESDDIFGFYIGTVLRRLEGVRLPAGDALVELVDGLGRVLRAPGATQRLWSSVLPGVPAALRDLGEAGYRLVAVSNADGTVEAGLRAAGLADAFLAVIDSHVVGFEKPDPRIFRHALEVADASPGSTLHVGDIYHVDVVGARAAGLHALLLDPHGDWDGFDCPRLPSVAHLRDRLLGRRSTSP